MSSESSSKFRQTFLLGLIAIISIVAGLWLSQKFMFSSNDTKIPQGLDATVLPKARILQDFSLTDKNGNAFSVANLKGQWNFLFFGFTHCPDVCPTTLAVMKNVWKQLPTQPGEKGHPNLVFVSVDPDRDKVDNLKQYIEFYHPDFNAVTGKLNQLDRLTNQIGILYGYDEKNGENDNDYIVNHSSQLIVVDPKGRMRAVISPPHIPNTIAANYQTMRVFYGDE